jgi:hypothetical protein
MVFAFLEYVRDMIVIGEKELDMAFMGLFATGLVVYLILRSLKKWTRLLRQTK